MSGHAKASTLLLACALLCAPAAADEADPARGQALYREGMKQYNVGHFTEALHAFEQGYLADPDANFLFNIGQCHRLMGHPKEEIYAYRRFLSAAPDAPNRVAVERFIAAAEEELKRQAATAPPMGTIPPAPTPHEPQPVGEPTPAPAPPPPAPSVEPEPTPAPAPAPAAAPAATTDGEEPRPVYKKWWLWTIVVAAVVVVAAGVTVGVLVGGGAHDAVLDHPSAPTAMVRF